MNISYKFAPLLLRSLVFLLAAYSLAVTTSAQEKDRYLNAKYSVLWKTLQIPVCWENGQDFAAERGWVQDRIQQEYGAKTPINFTGWGVCRQQSKGIRIFIEDFQTNPHTDGLGRQLDGKRSGMVFNFTFRNWSRPCQEQRQRCIENIAAHEFGHAIGLAHEQNRSDTFGANIFNACSDVPVGFHGTKTWGPWDPDSIMNYCNQVWINNGRLSAWDIEGINILYGGNRSVRDLGLVQPPRTVTDINGDGFKDYCRIVGKAPDHFVSCKFTDANGFRTDNEYHFNSITGIDLGDAALPRYFADVNGDGKADFCRFVGSAPKQMLSCNLAMDNGFSPDQYGFNSLEGFDMGQAFFRALTDVNGDGKADYCRFVGAGSKEVLSCNLATATGFSSAPDGFNSIDGLDQGHDRLPRTLVDMNGDGRADYCRYVGAKPNILLSCNYAGITGFEANQYSFKAELDADAFYNK